MEGSTNELACWVIPIKGQNLLSMGLALSPPAQLDLRTFILLMKNFKYTKRKADIWTSIHVNTSKFRQVLLVFHLKTFFFCQKPIVSCFVMDSRKVEPFVYYLHLFSIRLRIIIFPDVYISSGMPKVPHKLIITFYFLMLIKWYLESHFSFTIYTFHLINFLNANKQH